MATRAQACVVGLALSVALLAASAVQADQYVVDGFPLGSNAPDDPNYRTYACGPSAEYADTTQCTRELHKKGHAGDLVISARLLHARDGTTLYAMVHAAPVKLNRDAVQKEIGDLSQGIGASPTTITWSPDDSTDVTWVFVTWGKARLEEVSGWAEITDFPQFGSLVDLLDDPARSLDSYLPIYRLAGGPGYAYAASFDANGMGNRYYVAADPAELSIRHFRSSLRALLHQDRSLAKDDFSLWPDVARATRNLARDTSPDVANRELDAVFDDVGSSKLRSHVWSFLPLGPIQRLEAGQYWRYDVFGPRTKFPDIRRRAQNLIATEPNDPFIEFAYFLLGDFTDALKARPNSPISDVLHYASGYQIVQSLVHEALEAAKSRTTSDTPQETVDDLKGLLAIDPNAPEPEDTVPIGSGLVDGSLVFINRNPELFDNKPLSAVLPDFSGRAAEARAQFEAVSTATPIADDATYMMGWLDLQNGSTDKALSLFARALQVESKHSPGQDWDQFAWFDYRWGVLKEAVRIVERLPLNQQATTVEFEQVLRCRSLALVYGGTLGVSAFRLRARHRHRRRGPEEAEFSC